MVENRDLMIQALCVVVAGVAGLVLLNRSKTKKEVEAPTKPTVYGSCPLPPDADNSPACLKLETFFKMCGVDFDTVYFTEHQMKDSPTGKMPWLRWNQVNQGKPLGDSTLIINELVRLDPKKFNLDAHLTAEQSAIGTAFKTMLEESTYFTGVIQSRWVSREFDTVTVPNYFGPKGVPLPPLLRGLIIRNLRSKIVRDAQGHGTANVLTDAQVTEKCGMELQAISDFLGSKRYFMGDRITSFDAAVFAYLASMVHGDWSHDTCKAARQYQNVAEYVKRMRQEFWPELQ